MIQRLFIVFFLFAHFHLQALQIKVACVGNSVTYGAGVENREINSYPARLQTLLGDEYDVRNFGKSGATLLSKGHRPYIEQEEYHAALDFKPDFVVIHLGLNDTDPRNWPNFRDEFLTDYLSLIGSFRKENPACKIMVCRMSPIFHSHPRFKSGTRDWYWQIQETIENVAELSGSTLIDLHEKLCMRPDLLPDALHPNASGAAIIASTVYSALTGDYGGLQMSAIYSDNMILQRNEPLTISGMANAGDRIEVKLGEQKKQTTTGPDGKWSVLMEPLEAGKSFIMEVSSGDRILQFKNILAGEVWLCSGQSNMEFELGYTDEKEQQEQLAYAGSEPPIHFYDCKPFWRTNAVEWTVSALDSINDLQYFKPVQWETCTAEKASEISAVAFAFARMLTDSLRVPVGLIINAVGGSPTEAWIDRKTLEYEFPDILYNWTKNDFIQPWVRERAVHNMAKSTNKSQRHPYEPAYLFESGVLPLDRFPVKGVIWYQGESNAHNMEAHEKLFPMLVDSWRGYWGKMIPFYYVQLSGINRPAWPRFRDSQRRLMNEIANTGMAVSCDRGDSLDVHPRYKKEIGERLARWALHQTYEIDIIPSGPLVKSVDFTGSSATITFNYGEGLATSDGQPVRTFEIAGKEGLFFPAKAEISEERVKLSNENVSSPYWVRYGWQPFTRANLVNGAGLPASTFYVGKEMK